MNDTERLWAIVGEYVGCCSCLEMYGDHHPDCPQQAVTALRAEMQRLQGEVANLRAIATTEGYEAHIEAYEATMTALQAENAELREDNSELTRTLAEYKSWFDALGGQGLTAHKAALAEVERLQGEVAELRANARICDALPECQSEALRAQAAEEALARAEAVVTAMYADMKTDAKHHGYPCKNIEQYRHEAKLARHEAERRIKEAESHA